MSRFCRVLEGLNFCPRVVGVWSCGFRAFWLMICRSRLLRYRCWDLGTVSVVCMVVPCFINHFSGKDAIR